MPNSTESEIVALERQYWQAIQDQDIDTLTRLTDHPCIVAGAQGVASIGEEMFRKMMQDTSWKLNSFEVSNVQARQLRDDVVIVAYKVREVLTVDGKQLTLDASDASTWIRRDGQWACALHTESISGDPYGRDRTTSA